MIHNHESNSTINRQVVNNIEPKTSENNLKEMPSKISMKDIRNLANDTQLLFY